MSGTRGKGARRRRTERRAEARRATRKNIVEALTAATDAVETETPPKQAVRRLAVRDELATSGASGLPLGPRDATWDAAAADKAVRTWAGAEDAPNAKYAKAFFFKDGDGSSFGDYKLGFAEPVDDELTANWGGITAVAGALSGARGGVKIPDADAAAIKTKVAAYYEKAKAQYKDDSIKAPWDAKDDAAIQFAADHGVEVLTEPDGSRIYIGELDVDKLLAAQRAAEIDALAYAALGADADQAVFAVARFQIAQEFAMSELVWDAEDGVMDLMSDLSEALNPGDSWRWWVVDVATTMDKAILCDGDRAEYWLAPFTVGDDREPVLSPQSDWTPVESAWVKDTDEYVSRGRELADRLSARAAELAMGACAACDHAYTAHLGTEGPCTTDGCDCSGYEAAETDADGDAAAKGEQTPTGGNASSQWFMAGMENGWVSVKDGTSTFTLTFDPPAAAADDSITISPPADGGSMYEWSAVLAPEGTLTSDGRAFAPGSITWPRLDDGPLALMALLETGPGGHQGAKLAGNITEIWRDDAAGLIRAKGTFDTSEFGQEVARLVDDRMLRGVSVDLAIDRYTYGPRSDWFDEDGNWAPKAEADQDARPPVEILYDEHDPDVAIVLAAEIGMTTVCPFPAFKEAQIAIGDSLVATGSASSIWTVTAQAGFVVVRAVSGPLTASATPVDGSPCIDCGEQGDALTAAAEGLAPELPPAAWFENPNLEGPTAATLADDGRFYGHAALWETCHIGFPGRCQPPPHSETGYAYFHLGEVLCDDGRKVAAGTVTLDTGHARQGLSRADATRHYDDTGTATAYVRCGEDEYGIWFSGTLRPDVPAEKASLLRGAKLSGDWRKVDGNLELVALLTVNVPGFPVPRARQEFVGDAVVSLVAAGIVVTSDEIDPAMAARFEALRRSSEFAELAAEAA